MRAVILMFDSLNRHMIPPYFEDIIKAPNFKRLAQKTLTFNNFYAGSLPCMPARREMHTGRYNFLHRNWGPLEPFDDSMPEILSSNGVHTHLTTDHQHYFEDGGATYHTRYTTWEFHRGQEGDTWKGVVADKVESNGYWRLQSQDQINRTYMQTEDLHPQTLTYDSGLHFLEVNHKADNWMLQIETFDPHEPFFTYLQYLQEYPFEGEDPNYDWPPYGKMAENDQNLKSAQRHYKALVTQCDKSLGRVLDFMDANDMWKDTMLMVNTDHGYLLGEHGYWAKSMLPWYNELVHLPFFMHDPRNPQPGQTTDVLTQTIDIAPTMLSYFEKPVPVDMQGNDIAKVIEKVHAPREAGLFGLHSGHVNVTDGRYVYMRGCVSADNQPLEEYTLMPTKMRARFSQKNLLGWELGEPFSFTKGLQTVKVKAQDYGWTSPWRFGTLLFDLENDPAQTNPLLDEVLETRMAELLVQQMRLNDAPASQYVRLGLPQYGPVGREHLLCAEQNARAMAAAEPMPIFETIPEPLKQPFAVLLNNPSIKPILHEHLPESTTGEFLSTSGNFNLEAVARLSLITSAKLKAIIAAFNAL